MAIFCLFYGCGDKKKDDSKTSQDSITKQYSTTEKINFEKKDLVKSVNNCRPGEKGCTYIHITYVEAADGKIKDRINAIIKNGLLTAYEMPDKNLDNTQLMMDSYIRDFESFKKQFPKVIQEWTVEFDARVYSETEKIICFAFENYSYLGGAHPNMVMTFRNVSRETGDTLSLPDLFGQGFEEKLNALIDKNYRRMKGLNPGDNLQEKGELFENFIKFNYNFSVTGEKGVEFFYNAYEIAPYAAGPVVVTLSAQDIAGIISGASPLK